MFTRQLRTVGEEGESLYASQLKLRFQALFNLCQDSDQYNTIHLICIVHHSNQFLINLL